MASPGLKAVIFDSDGTLLDSFELIYAAQIAAAKAHGQRPPTREAYRAQLGKSLLQIFEALYPGADHQGMMATNGDYFAAHATEAIMFEGLHALLQDLQARGLKLALLTGGNHKIYDALRHHGLGSAEELKTAGAKYLVGSLSELQELLMVTIPQHQGTVLLPTVVRRLLGAAG
jgi:phosphoglycolate phosphatase-like HAD superfamily hydrolase